MRTESFEVGSSDEMRLPRAERWGRRSGNAAALLLAAAFVSACGNDPTDIEDGPENPPEVADVDAYVGGLGSWEAFTPTLPESNGPTGAQVTVEEVVDNTTYECSVTPYSLTTTPREIVMHEPNASIMWVGNLLQGDSYAGGTGSFEELSIRQRAPLKISIDLLTGDNFAIVENPSLTSVQAAIGALIQKAVDAGHLSGSSIDYRSTRLYTTVQAIREGGLSANFLYKGIPVGLGAETGWELNASLRGVLAHFTQKMFTISIELPQSPGDFFSDELTPDLLEQQIDAGNLGPDNLPVYIANITYGRTLTYTLFSSDVEARLHAAVEASISGFKGVDAGGYSEQELRTTLGTEYLRATSIGGDGQNLIDLIREGELSAYFTTDAALTTARPISYQLNFLGDNSIAKVSETTEYDLRTCNEKSANAGRFDFLGLQSETAGVGTPYTIHEADVNGDGRGDVVLSHLQSGQNRMRVGFGNADGTFTFAAAVTHPAAPTESWADGYVTRVGDFDGDGSDDLVWNRVRPDEPNRVYVALSDGAGGFTFLDPEEFGSSWASTWETYVGDADGDGDDDLFFNYRSNARNLSRIGLADGDGTFTLGAQQEHPAGGNWALYDVLIGDVDGGARDDDLIWNWVPQDGSSNYVRIGRSNGDGTIAFPGGQSFLSGWTNYVKHAGDVNGDGRTDLTWTRTTGGTFYLHRALGQSDGSFHLKSGAQAMVREEGHFGTDDPVHTRLGDFDGDGIDDMLFNRLTATKNDVRVALGGSKGDFSFTPSAQAHTGVNSEGWTQFADNILTMDVTGDGVDDVVWMHPASTLRIYVATGR